MNTKAYKFALGGALGLCAVLAGILGYLLLTRSIALPSLVRSQERSDTDPVIARGPANSQQRPAASEAASTVEEPQIAPVQLTPQRMQEIGVTTAFAEMKVISNPLQVPGNVEINEQKLAYVQTRFPGWIQKVFANATMQYVQKGQPLFTIYSPDLVSSEQEYLLARKNQAAFSGSMADYGASKTMPNMPGQESGWLMQAALQRMEQFGVAPAEIADLEKSGNVKKEIAVYSPVSGYITERNAIPNAYAQPDTKLYTIADLNNVWVYANVFQNDVGRLRAGDVAQVTVDAYPGRTFHGRVDQVLPEVDQATRTVKVRLVLANRGLALKPGMYVNVNIAADLGRQLVVPASAVLQSGQRAVVFIDRGQGNLDPRVVTTGAQIDGSTIILSGLKAGDRVVSSANFLIDSEAQLQASMQNFNPPAATATTSNEAPANAVAIAFSTNPSTPRKGKNDIRVVLTGADGKPLSGVQATTTFFMPAMPEMGMAAMHAAVSLVDKGNGNFAGALDLPTGGTWQVTVTVVRGSQVIATKKLSVDATGGM